MGVVEDFMEVNELLGAWDKASCILVYIKPCIVLGAIVYVILIDCSVDTKHGQLL